MLKFSRVINFLVVHGLVVGLFGLATAPSFADNEESLNGDFTISDGTMVNVEDKGFAMTPPVGWQVFRNRPGQTLMMQVPKEPNQVYQRTIQVTAFNGAKYIDDIEAEKFSQTLVTKFSGMTGAINAYRIRNHLPVELEGGIAGYLFYAEFTVNEFQMMQMHVLISSADRHFLMTYTDLAEYFDTEKSKSGHLDEAWKAFGSVQLQSAAPVRFQFPLVMALLALGVGVGGFFYLRIGGKRAGKRYGEQMKKLENDAADDYIPSKSHVPTSIVPEDGGDEVKEDDSVYRTAHDAEDEIDMFEDDADKVG